ncbi:MAG: hypothetical protein A3A86_00210 [Elusimicrobia bacterium RIFCSPLOWO2_01_FULL_60_11]|nr:MAG: hypothetical protein A3A86_00210 [Elusimicrobia bacterium RIFCSPLOWO2_01_FULL_60_11]
MRQGVGDIFQGGAPALGFELQVAPPCPLQGRGVEEEFEPGLGEDARADVAAFHHDAALPPHPLLHLIQDLAHAFDLGELVGVQAHAAGTDLGGSGFPVHEQMFVFEHHLGAPRESRQGGGVVKVQVVSQGLPSEGAVERSRVHIDEAELARHHAGDGGFPGPGGAIDGDDGSFLHRGRERDFRSLMNPG